MEEVFLNILRRWLRFVFVCILGVSERCCLSCELWFALL